MPSAVILPNPKAAFITSAGAPAVGYKLYTYDAGTLVPRTTYLDAAGAANNTNPIILDARGEAVIYWNGSYKVILKDAADVTIWTVDNFNFGVSPLTLDSVNGRLGINMTPANVLDITQTQNAPSIAALLNASAGVAAQARFQVINNAGSLALLGIFGSGFTPAGISKAGGALIYCNGPGGITMDAVTGPIVFAINDVATHSMNDGNGNTALGVTNTGNATPTGQSIRYTAAAPNGVGNEFLLCADNAATRATIRSNGGLANFSANNVNLSDITVKPAFEPLTDSDLIALEQSFIAIDFARFKYDGQTHDDWNYGYSAQGVEAAFALTVPAMTDIWNPETAIQVEDGAGNLVEQKIPTPVKDQLLAVYTEDLHNIAHALLARALKRIATLEARLAAAGIP